MDDLWLKNARHANKMASFLAEQIRPIVQITITQKVESNVVFAILPKEWIQLLQVDFYFYIWNEELSEVRLMTSWDTQEKDIIDLVTVFKKISQAD